jgi:predicted house-cleaning noncanonical NTP pyrophosphatase (MazG superfamily)
MSNGNGSNGKSHYPLSVLGSESGIASLANRLTQDQDRERYADLVSYIQRLPPTDEFRQVAEWFGLWALMWQQIPEALADFLETFRAELAASAEYHAKLEERLAKLPEEIASGVRPEEIASAMAESFRQQIAAVGLEQSSALLQQSTAEIKALYGELSKTVKPAVIECKTVASSLSDGVTKILKASSALQAHNTSLKNESQKSSWWLVGLWVVVLVLVGVALGMHMGESRTEARLAELEAQMQRVIDLATTKPAQPVAKNRTGR